MSYFKFLVNIPRGSWHESPRRLTGHEQVASYVALAFFVHTPGPQLLFTQGSTQNKL